MYHEGGTWTKNQNKQKNALIMVTGVTTLSHAFYGVTALTYKWKLARK